MHLRVAELDRWWRATFLNRHELVYVAGDFRNGARRAEIDLIELGGSEADSVRILVPRSTPVPAQQGQKPQTCQFSEGNDNRWWNGWASVFVSAVLAAPIVDPVRLADLVRDRRRIRFCCDTNALAGGVVSWLLVFLGPRADVVTSAVVDRELAAWPDRGGPDFWCARTPESWSLRTQYRVARRLIEAPPNGVVVDRLSPEQGALMLAKLRDEQRLGKSPDADVLLVELARSLVRDQPRNARVVFLTGDRNNARTATGALGAENVLFAAADAERVRLLHNRIVTRGAWQPRGPLGSVHVPTVGSLLWDLLAPCDRLVVRSDTRRWELAPCTSIPRGAPSDWEDPWVEVRELPPVAHARPPGGSTGTGAASTETGAASTETGAASTHELVQSPVDAAVTTTRTRLLATLDARVQLLVEEDRVRRERTLLLATLEVPAQGFVKLPKARPTQGASPRPPMAPALHVAGGAVALAQMPSPEPPRAFAASEDWLLPPVKVGPVLDLSLGIRPSPGVFFPLLARALGGDFPFVMAQHSDTTLDEARRILLALGAVRSDGGPGVRADEFRDAWQRRDHDWFHAELKRLPGYVAALALVRTNAGGTRSSRPEAHISMARALGEVARLDKIGGVPVVGDAPVRRSQLLDALDRWLPEPGATLGTTELCRLAEADLFVTPSRFERAMELLWAGGFGVQFEGRTGGTVVPGFAERVIALGPLVPRFRTVAPGDLSFGRSGPVRFVTRVR